MRVSANEQHQSPPASRSAILHGTLWAALTVIVWSAWPAFTRLAVTESVTPADIVLLRYGIGGLILLPVLLPIANAFQWDLTWFGVVLTMMIAIGQFTPPMAVNLMVSCRIAGVSMESTVPWVIWLVLAMTLSAVAVMAIPDLALWLPRMMGLG